MDILKHSYNLPKKNVIQFNNKKKDNGIPIDTPIVIPVRGVA
jgi:LysM repeat protein